MKIKKELIIFIVLFVLLSFGMHYKEFLEYPLGHIQNLPNSALGIFHPLYLTFILYLIMLLIRFIFLFMIKLIRR